MQQNLHTVSRSINSQAAQIRNSLSEIEKSLNKIASNEDIKNKKEKNKTKKGVKLLYNLYRRPGSNRHVLADTGF